MISGEHIHDALTLLPEELVAPVDALRRKKRIPWKGLCAVAACLCLVAGLWFLLPGAVAMDSANGSAEHAPGDGFGAVSDSVTGESAHGTILTATVLTVEEDCVTVLLGDRLPDNAVVSLAYRTEIRFDELDADPRLEQRQFIRLYFDNPPELKDSDRVLYPNRIEIIEDKGG